MKRIFLFGTKIPIWVLTGLPLLEFFWGITEYKQLNSVPLVGKYIYQFINLFEQPVLTILVVFAIIYIVSKIFLWLIEREENIDSGRKLHEFSHELRDRIVEVASTDVGTSITSFYTQVQHSSQGICNDICSFLKTYTGKDFNVCIKLIEPTSSKRTISKNEIKLMTLCRAGEDKVSRGTGDGHEEIYLKDNSDFDMIYGSHGIPSTNVFATHNLPLYILQRKLIGKPYKSSTEKPTKKYKSTIVVPIRVSNRCDKTDTKKGYTLNGFLCIDYKWIVSRTLIKKLTNYAKSFGDSLYAFYRAVDLKDQEIRKASKI